MWEELQSVTTWFRPNANIRLWPHTSEKLQSGTVWFRPGVGDELLGCDGTWHPDAYNEGQEGELLLDYLKSCKVNCLSITKSSKSFKTLHEYGVQVSTSTPHRDVDTETAKPGFRFESAPPSHILILQKWGSGASQHPPNRS